MNLPPYWYGKATPNNNFGVTAVSSEEVQNPEAFIVDRTKLARVNRDLMYRWCGFSGDTMKLGGDPLLSEAHFSVLDKTDPNRLITEAEWRANMAAKFGRVHWKDAKLGLYPAGEYFVMYMTEGRSGDLEVRVEHAWKAETLALYLPIETLDGQVVTLTLRLECGFQPMLKTRAEVPPALLKYL